MPYRIERAKTGRAVCKDKVCKENEVKIEKGELRLGTWVEIQGHGSWSWKHWGCTTGKQLENLREYLEDSAAPDGYDWDKMDGFDDEAEKTALSDAEKDKLKRAVMDGQIDPEDFRGDPEKNRLGERGIHGPAKNPDSDEEAEKPTKKRSRVKKDSVAAGDEEKPKKRARKTKAAADEGEAGAEEAAEKPARRTRTKAARDTANNAKEPAKKPSQPVEDEGEEETEEEPKPVKKKGRKAAKKDEPPEEQEVTKPTANTRKPRSKKAAEQDTTASARPRTSRARKA